MLVAFLAAALVVGSVSRAPLAAPVAVIALGIPATGGVWPVDREREP